MVWCVATRELGRPGSSKTGRAGSPPFAAWCDKYRPSPPPSAGHRLTTTGSPGSDNRWRYPALTGENWDCGPVLYTLLPESSEIIRHRKLPVTQEYTSGPRPGVLVCDIDLTLQSYGSTDQLIQITSSPAGHPDTYRLHIYISPPGTARRLLPGLTPHITPR